MYTMAFAESSSSGASAQLPVVLNHLFHHWGTGQIRPQIGKGTLQAPPPTSGFDFCVLRFAHKGRTRLLPLRYCDSSTLKSPKLCSSSVFCRCYTPASRAALPVRSHALGPAARPAWLLGPTPHFFDQAVFGIGCSFQIPGCILYCRQQRGHAASDLRMPTQPGKNLFVAARLCLHCAAPISWNGHALRCIGLNRTRPFANFGE